MNDFNSLLNKHIKNITKNITKEDSDKPEKLYSEEEMILSPEDADESEVKQLLKDIKEKS